MDGTRIVIAWLVEDQWKDRSLGHLPYKPRMGTRKRYDVSYTQRRGPRGWAGVDARKVERLIRKTKRGRGFVTLEDLRREVGTSDWARLYEAVRPHLESGLIVPVKSAKCNGIAATPVFEKYRIVPDERPAHAITELHPQLVSTTYLERHPEICDKFWPNLLALSSWLREGPHERDVTLRERCWEVFGDEKASDSKGLCRCVRHASGIELRELLCVLDDEPEDLPFAMAPHVAHPAHVVVVENRDPFLAIRRHLLAGGGGVFGTPVDAVVFGRGNVVRQAGGASLARALASMGAARDAEVLYWGDIDREGLTILVALCNAGLAKPHVRAYECMLAAAIHPPRPSPDGRELPMPDLTGVFEDALAREIAAIASAGLLLPQEVLGAKAIRGARS